MLPELSGDSYNDDSVLELTDECNFRLCFHKVLNKVAFLLESCFIEFMAN